MGGAGVIIATAGHVDHGKTTLIKALTGRNTDRLDEEQRRGLTIDLGFAWLHDPRAGAIGFVDVPGHARFIRTMLAGIAGVDTALLVIAADEGPMPQTRFVTMKAFAQGLHPIVVINKVDLVSDGQVRQLELLLKRLNRAAEVSVVFLNGPKQDSDMKHLT
jgi:selenocysteine-specific elongation factor